MANTAVTIGIDQSELDQALEKANRLVELLREASGIISSLCEIKQDPPERSFAPTKEQVQKITTFSLRNQVVPGSTRDIVEETQV